MTSSRPWSSSLLVVAAVHAAGLGLWWEEEPLVLVLAVGSAAVEIVLGCRLALLAASRRDHCVTLILKGGEHLPLTGVRRERRRLASLRCRSRLARSVDDLADEADRRGVRPPRPRPIYEMRVVVPAVPQLHEVARLLRTDAPSVRGVALIERLISSGGSALYGRDPELLARELRRASYLLNQ